jgi:hypothetical protein
LLFSDCRVLANDTAVDSEEKRPYSVISVHYEVRTADTRALSKPVRLPVTRNALPPGRDPSNRRTSRVGTPTQLSNFATVRPRDATG